MALPALLFLSLVQPGLVLSDEVEKMLNPAYIVRLLKESQALVADAVPLKEVLRRARLTTRAGEEPGAPAMDRRQCRVSPHQRFPCSAMLPSPTVPSSVHSLRPGDIQVVAGLGDSVMAAFGAGADSMLDVSVEFRAMSFAMGGGDGDWRECLTLPNILSQFNPSLRGASTANTSAGLFQVSGYNLAVSGATSHSLADQAWSLVRRMRADPWVDLHSDWKMVTVIIGHNDLCRLPCNYKDPAGTATTFLQDWITGSRGMDTTGRFRPGNGGPPLYVQNIRRALDVLHANLPRTFVNLVPITDVAMTLGLVDKPRVCQLTHFNECPCLFDEGIFTTGRISGDEARALTEGYRLGLEQLVASGRYDTRQDFTVVIQPALMDAALPKVFRPAFGRLLPDISFLAPDCFHFSQALHALMARSVWNNLLQPVGRKTTSWEKDVPFLCPSAARPFLATAGQVAAGEAAMESIAQDWRAARALHLVGDCSL